MWTYEQATGKLSHDGQLVGVGYAGGNIPPHHDPTAVNNPARERDRMFGPLPRGRYTILGAGTNGNLGPVSMRLAPAPSNEMYGRAGFFIHADSMAHPGQASEGCIVMPLDARNAIATSKDRQLTVV